MSNVVQFRSRIDMEADADEKQALTDAVWAALNDGLLPEEVRAVVRAVLKEQRAMDREDDELGE